MVKLKSNLFELVWLVITIVFMLLVILPFLINEISFPLLMTNIFWVLLSITLTRYIFQLKYTWLARKNLVKALLSVLCIPLFIWSLDQMYEFQSYNDEIGLQSLVTNLEPDIQSSYIQYIRSEYIFFGTLMIILCFAFPLRMIISVWRMRNSNSI